MKSEKKISNEQALKLESNRKFVNLECLAMNRADEQKEYFEELRKENAQLFARDAKLVKKQENDAYDRLAFNAMTLTDLHKSTVDATAFSKFRAGFAGYVEHNSAKNAGHGYIPVDTNLTNSPAYNEKKSRKKLERTSLALAVLENHLEAENKFLHGAHIVLTFPNLDLPFAGDLVHQVYAKRYRKVFQTENVKKLTRFSAKHFAGCMVNFECTINEEKLKKQDVSGIFNFHAHCFMLFDAKISRYNLKKLKNEIFKSWQAINSDIKLSADACSCEPFYDKAGNEDSAKAIVEATKYNVKPKHLDVLSIDDSRIKNIDDANNVELTNEEKFNLLVFNELYKIFSFKEARLEVEIDENGKERVVKRDVNRILRQTLNDKLKFAYEASSKMLQSDVLKNSVLFALRKKVSDFDSANDVDELRTYISDLIIGKCREHAFLKNTKALNAKEVLLANSRLFAGAIWDSFDYDKLESAILKEACEDDETLTYDDLSKSTQMMLDFLKAKIKPFDSVEKIIIENKAKIIFLKDCLKKVKEKKDARRIELKIKDYEILVDSLKAYNEDADKVNNMLAFDADFEVKAMKVRAEFKKRVGRFGKKYRDVAINELASGKFAIVNPKFKSVAEREAVATLYRELREVYAYYMNVFFKRNVYFDELDERRITLDSLAENESAFDSMSLLVAILQNRKVGAFKCADAIADYSQGYVEIYQKYKEISVEVFDSMSEVAKKMSNHYSFVNMKVHAQRRKRAKEVRELANVA